MAVVTDRSFETVWPHVMKTLKSADPARHVVVFDIDATLLYNTDDNECGAIPNFKVQSIYDYCEKKGVPIHIVTARIGTEVNRRLTQRQLACMGFFQYDSLYMRPGTVQSTPQVAQFKAQSRADIEQRTGKKVLLNIGDQWSDVVVAPSTASYDDLDAQFGAKHVLFQPPPSGYAQVALKLYETKD